MTIDTENNMNTVNTETAPNLSLEELDDLFDEPTEAKPKLSKEEKRQLLLRSAGYTASLSYAEMVERIKKYKGKPLEEIPLNARYGYALLNVVKSDKPSATGQNGLGYKTAGYEPKYSLTRLAIEWGNIHYTTLDEKGVFQTYRLPDEKRSPLTVSFFLSPETLDLIEQIMADLGTNVVNMGIVFNAEATVTELTMKAQREQYLAMQSTHRDKSNPDDPEKEDSFTSWSATVNNVFIDESTIVPAAQVNLSLRIKDPETLIALMSQSAVTGFDNSRKLRRQQVIGQDLAAPPSGNPDPLNQMDAATQVDV
jgi:hypothetical protein